MPSSAVLPPLDGAFRKLCLTSEGVLQNGPALQLGFKSDFRAHAARVGIYLANVGASPIAGLVIEVMLPPGTQGSLAVSSGAIEPNLAPRAQLLHMLSFELNAPFAQPPQLSVSWGGGGVKLHLPVMPFRFHTPWPLVKDDYFRLWRAAELKECQTKFTFRRPGDHSAEIKALLSGVLRLAVLEGVDPSPTNICAAGALACKGGAAPPAPGGQYALLRLEIIPDYATGPDGAKRAASRLTVRATHAALAESLNQSLTAQLS